MYEKCSPSLTIKAIKYHFISVRIAFSKMTTDKSDKDSDRGKQTLVRTWIIINTIKSTTETPREIKNVSSIRLEIQPQGTCTKKSDSSYSCTPVFSEILIIITKKWNEPKSLQVKTGVKKRWCIYAIKWFVLWKEGKSTIFSNTGEPMLSETIDVQKSNSCLTRANTWTHILRQKGSSFWMWERRLGDGAMLAS